MSEFSKGPAYGSLSLSMGHSGARPMEHLQGDMGPVYTQQPMESHAQTGGRVSGNAAAPGGGWDGHVRAPMATPTRGTKNP